MMRLLALETSTEYCSVALWQDGAVIERRELAGQRHSERLISMIDEVLHEGGMKLADLDGIAYGAGPGSFTGVRIACGVAQGLALGAGKPVAGISTLLALAEASGADCVIAALDARMSEVYHAAFEKYEWGWHTVCAPALCLPENAPFIAGNGWIGVGSGFNTQESALRASYAGNLAGVDAAAIPEARAIAALAAPQFAAGLGMDAAQATPLYLREKVALTTEEREARANYAQFS
jgi:tRNA threonylcarbamoyladenosine biosynthesis protein TsaB